MSDATQDPQPTVPVRRGPRAEASRPRPTKILGEFARRDDVDEMKRQAVDLLRYRLRWVASEMHRRLAPLVREGAAPDRVSEQLRVVTAKHGDLLEKAFARMLQRLPTVLLEPGPDRTLLAYSPGGDGQPIDALPRMPKLTSKLDVGPRDE